MRFTSIILALAASVTALPAAAPDSFQMMVERFTEIPDCQRTPGKNCAGVENKDVIIQYHKNQTQEQKDLFLNAAKASGAVIHEVMNDFGFTGFIPDNVVALIQAYGATIGLKVINNGCTGIPWCGEAPC